MKIRINPPYDFQLSTSIFSRYTAQVADYYLDGKYIRVLRDGKSISLVEVQSVGKIEKPCIKIRSLIPRTMAINIVLANRIKWILGVDNDLRDFYEIMDQDPVTHRLKRSLFGLKPPRSENMFEALISAIFEQQISLAAAMTIRERFAKKYGLTINYEGFEYVGFPKPEDLIFSNKEELQSLGINSRKANAIITIAQHILSEKIDLEALSKAPAEEVMDTLTSVNGIGPWTVQYMLIKGAGRYDSFPNNDLALLAGIRNCYRDESLKSQNDVHRILSRFGRYSGYAALYFILSHVFEKYQS